MRNFKEVKDIASKLTILEELKEPLQGVLGEINTLLYKGTSWIEQKESQSYKEIKELLDKKTSDFIRRCFVIANNGSERCSQVNEERSRADSIVSVDQTNISLKDESEFLVVIKKINDLTTNVTSNTEVIQSLQQKIKDHDKLLRHVSKISLQTNKYGHEEGMRELTAAGNLLTNIQSPKEPSSEEKYQCPYEKDISLRVTEGSERRLLVDKEHENLENLKQEIKRLTDDLVFSKETVTSREFEIAGLKEENGRINERLEQLQEIFGEMKEERGLVNERLEQCYNSMDKKNDEIGILDVHLKQLNETMEPIKKERDNAIEMLKVCKDKFQLIKNYIVDTTFDYSMPVDVRKLKCGHDTKGFEMYICQQQNCICLDCWRQTFLSYIPEIVE